MSLVLKWFVRLGLGAAALGSVAFLPVGIFLGTMATDGVGTGGCAHGSDCARDTIRIAYFIMATPLILFGIFIIALVWVERHPKYRAAMAGLFHALILGVFVTVPRDMLLGMLSGIPDFWRPFLR